MWKPGSDKPMAQHATTVETTRMVATTPDSSKKRRKTELSRGTKNMRFMQRGLATSVNAEQKDCPMEVDTGGALDRDAIKHNSPPILTTNEYEDSLDDKATPVDMYGIEGDVAIGRRSFGGFNAVVAENWFRQKQEIFLKKKKSNKSQEKQDQQLIQEFDQLERYDKKLQGKNKKRTNGISNGSKKRTKTLEDILMIASP